VVVRETFNSGRSTASVIETMGFGVPMDEWTDRSPMGSTFDRIFTQLIHNMARTFEVELAGVERSVRTYPAPHDIRLPTALIREGTVAGIALRWEGVPADPDQIRLVKETRWVCTDDLPELPVESGWQVEITGTPSLRATITMTNADEDRREKDATMVGGAIPLIDEVVRAEPGILAPAVFAPFRKRFPAAQAR